MVHEVKISAEVARLAQYRTRGLGTALSDELTRTIVQEEILEADPESGLLLEEDAAYSAQDLLVASFGVSDIVVSGSRFDVRKLDVDGCVSIARALVNDTYMSQGSLVVAFNSNLGGSVVGFITAAQWVVLDRAAGDQQNLNIKFAFDPAFSLLAALRAQPAKIEPAHSASDLPAVDLAVFFASRDQLSIEKQKQVVQAALTNRQLWPQMQDISAAWSQAKLRQVLTHASDWNLRIEQIAKLAAPRCKHLSKEDICKLVARVGESCGGQPESPLFRKVLLSTLSQAELSVSLSGSAYKKAAELAQAVLAGRTLAEAVKDVVRNPVSLQIAGQIKQKREAISTFIDASAQELAAAFQQLALQPAYATHSSDPASGMESINEALRMLDAGQLAESLRTLDSEIANS